MDMKLVNFTMPRSLEAKLSEGAKRTGKKKSEFVRDCLVKELIRLGIEVLPEDLESNQGARHDLPNRITEAEKRSRKGTRPRGRPRKTLPVPPIPPVRNVRINPDGSFSPVSAPPETSSTHRQSAA